MSRRVLATAFVAALAALSLVVADDLRLRAAPHPVDGEHVTAGTLAEMARTERATLAVVGEIAGRLAEVENRLRASPVAAPSPSLAKPDEPTPERLADPAVAESVAHGRALIDASLVSGRWTETDRVSLAATLAELSASDGAELLQRLLIALNSGVLRSEVQGPPI